MSVQLKIKKKKKTSYFRNLGLAKYLLQMNISQTFVTTDKVLNILECFKLCFTYFFTKQLHIS